MHTLTTNTKQNTPRYLTFACIADWLYLVGFSLFIVVQSESLPHTEDTFLHYNGVPINNPNNAISSKLMLQSLPGNCEGASKSTWVIQVEDNLRVLFNNAMTIKIRGLLRLAHECRHLRVKGLLRCHLSWP
jgi:hypothetical protein